MAEEKRTLKILTYFTPYPEKKRKKMEMLVFERITASFSHFAALAPSALLLGCLEKVSYPLQPLDELRFLA